MKKIILFTILVLSIQRLLAQAQEGYVSYQKIQQPAAFIYVPYPESTVNKAMDDYLSKKGSKANDIKGFKTFRNTSWAPQDTTNADMYFKIEQKSRKEKDQATVYLMVGSPNSDIALNNPGNKMSMQQAKDFLNSLIPVLNAYDLELRIQEQNDLVSKEEKKYKNLVDDGIDLEKKKAAIENKIMDNKKDQVKQTSVVEKEKQNLAQLAAQRK